MYGIALPAPSFPARTHIQPSSGHQPQLLLGLRTRVSRLHRVATASCTHTRMNRIPRRKILPGTVLESGPAASRDSPHQRSFVWTRLRGQCNTTLSEGPAPARRLSASGLAARTLPDIGDFCSVPRTCSATRSRRTSPALVDPRQETRQGAVPAAARRRVLHALSSRPSTIAGFPIRHTSPGSERRVLIQYTPLPPGHSPNLRPYASHIHFERIAIQCLSWRDSDSSSGPCVRGLSPRLPAPSSLRHIAVPVAGPSLVSRLLPHSPPINEPSPGHAGGAFIRVELMHPAGMMPGRDAHHPRRHPRSREM
ncbi:hypothetical protein C8Q77DRAFT_683208 [Trametes polyzona]|nr:hypothetical protein C8Q77DRAFT_683208 [Trametes polyzona]